MIDTNTACTGTNFVFIAAYLGSFDPNNICTNWIGDSGGSPNPDQPFSVNLAAGQTVVVVVSEVTPNAGCPDYTLTVTGLCGGPPPPPVCNYTISGGTNPIVPGVTNINNHCDDCDTSVALPFPFTLYDQSFNSVNVSSNGRLDFVVANEPGGFQTSCLPAPPNIGPYDYTIFGLWHDQRTDIGLPGCAGFPGGQCGVFTSVSGSAPNRIFNVEFRTVRFDDPTQRENYEVRLYENPALNKRFDVIYGTLTGVTTADVAGVQGDAGNGLFTQDFCNAVPPQNVSRTYTRSCAPIPSGAVSRKTHGGAGIFDINLPLVPIGGAVGIEDRTGAVTGAHTIVVTFANPVTVAGVAVTSGIGAATFSVAGAEVTINLTGVADAQRLGVTLMNVNDGTTAGDVLIPMGVLLGDTNASGGVSGTDVAQTKAQSGATTNAGNFRTDVNANGSITAVDVSLVKFKSGSVLPP